MKKDISHEIYEEKDYFFSINSHTNLSQRHYGYYTIIYMFSGNAINSINDKICDIYETQYIVLRPNDSYELIDIPSQSVLFMIDVVSDEFMKICDYYSKTITTFIKTNNEPISVTGDINVKHIIDEIYLRMIRIGDVDNLLCRLMVGEIVSGIFRFLHRKYSMNEIPSDLITAISAMCFEENLKEGVPALQKLSNYSRTHLCRLIKKYYNVTPHELVENIRCDYAYNLIKTTDLDYATISEKIGYNSISHFYKKFTSVYGLTPATLRKRSNPIANQSKKKVNQNKKN